ncbi:MAG: cytidine deaminase [Chloroflexota bacterium]|nr:cytidine deaminase [Dehalococcoidia bacterium]MDW8252588.1 cytidine deaminase [Chloroflexota bacterium]
MAIDRADEARLLAAARAARAASYSPYSGFAVGAAVRGASGQIYRGTNVENASFGLTLCAERVAVGAAVTAGERAITAIAIVAAPSAVPPCGACRQVLWELWAHDQRDAPSVLIAAVDARDPIRRSVRSLLPEAFERASFFGDPPRA